jgi:hypothetical protein
MPQAGAIENLLIAIIGQAKADAGLAEAPVCSAVNWHTFCDWNYCFLALVFFAEVSPARWAMIWSLIPS